MRLPLCTDYPAYAQVRDRSDHSAWAPRDRTGADRYQPSGLAVNTMYPKPGNTIQTTPKTFPRIAKPLPPSPLRHICPSATHPSQIDTGPVTPTMAAATATGLLR